jgi:hypothetical protein
VVDVALKLWCRYNSTLPYKLTLQCCGSPASKPQKVAPPEPRDAKHPAVHHVRAGQMNCSCEFEEEWVLFWEEQFHSRETLAKKKGGTYLDLQITAVRLRRKWSRCSGKVLVKGVDCLSQTVKPVSDLTVELAVDKRRLNFRTSDYEVGWGRLLLPCGAKDVRTAH